MVIGDAERMVVQEGTDVAANAFLKLLEEPLPDTTLLLTSSDPGALLPDYSVAGSHGQGAASFRRRYSHVGRRR